MRIEYLYRYPVKGLTAEALETAEVEAGGCIPWDRAFALAQGDAGFDPGSARHGCRKMNFMCLKRNARIAALRSSFEPRIGHADHPGAGWRVRSENALTEDGPGADRRVPHALHGRGGARHAALPLRARSHASATRAEGGQPDQPGQPARFRGAGRRAPASAAVPRQCLVHRRGAWAELDWVGTGNSARRRRACGCSSGSRAARRPR